MEVAMVSLRRRQVIIAGLGSSVAPAALSAIVWKEEGPERFVLSGRIVAADGRPLAGAAVEAGAARTATDADGRFVVVSNTRHYRVSHRGRSAEGVVSNQRPDADGTWRASFALTLA
jgi:protocatechuate 3,4-dioxygenase beta subunit